MLRAKKPDGLLTVLGGNFRTAPSSPKSAGVGGIRPGAQLAPHRCRRLPRRRQRPAPPPGRAAPLPAGSPGLPAAAAARRGVGGIAPPRLTQATPEPPVGIVEGSSGEGKHLSKCTKGRRRRGALYLCERAELRNSLRIPPPPTLFSFGSRAAGVGHPHHPRQGRGGWGWGRALLGGGGRGSGGRRGAPDGPRAAPGRRRCSPASPGGEDAAGGQGRVGQGRAGQARAGLRRAGLRSAHRPSGGGDSQGPSFGLAGTRLELLGQAETVRCET